jgi:hypothetical protein
MRTLRAALFVLAFPLMLTSPAAAVIGTIDAVPAATLLLPYFEVDLGDSNGMTTLFSINNASASAILAHVVVWSDLSVPVLDFNIYLTGFDVQTLNLRDILVNGVLPRTASAGQDPGDTISPQDIFSQDINFASCSGLLPPPVLPASFIQHLQRSLTGKSSPVLGNLCAGRDLGDNSARGYVTVDTVNNCTLRFPGDPGYFGGDAVDQNVLWGDFVFLDSGGSFAGGDPLVHIEASATNPETSVAGQYTFYGRYVSWTAADHREPLVTTFAARYINGGAFSGGTDFVVWRDSKVNQSAFACPVAAGSRPSWYPLGQERIVIFDEEENPQVPASFPVSPQPPEQGLTPFPVETQRVEVGSAALPISTNFGWMYLNLNTTVTAAGANPPEDPAAAQAWVVELMFGNGPEKVRRGNRFGIMKSSNSLDNATAANHSSPP